MVPVQRPVFISPPHVGEWASAWQLHPGCVSAEAVGILASRVVNPPSDVTPYALISEYRTAPVKLPCRQGL